MSMTSIEQLLQQGTGNAAWFILTALVLGALHGLEPGHSKTMMAAFIIAIRGTVRQAALLGLCAAFSHSLVIWALAAVGLHFGSQINTEQAEPYFQVLAGTIILATAAWMAWRTRRDVLLSAAHGHHHHHAHGDHEHPHHAHAGESAHPHPHPHNAAGQEYQDAHERAHAEEIAARFKGQPVTNGQLILFGLTGGLLPCPAALTVLLLCLQLKRFTLGFVLVLCFSIGLAITLVSVGAAAAWSVRHASRRFQNFDQITRRLPYLSSVLLLVVGTYLLVLGIRVLMR